MKKKLKYITHVLLFTLLGNTIKSIKILFFLLFVFIITSLKPASALDTTESFSPGILTEFEGYYICDWEYETINRSEEFLLGGGITEKFSYYVTFAFGQEDEEHSSTIKTIGGIGLGLVWTAVEINKNFAIDLLPFFSFESNKISDDQKTVKPNFKGFSYGGSIEFNCMMLEIIQPYFLAGYTNYHNSSQGSDNNYYDDPFEFPLSAGILFKIKEGVDVLAQLDWTPSEDNKKWVETNRSVVIGLNVMLSENLEIILDYWDDHLIHTHKNWGIGVGAILAL